MTELKRVVREDEPCEHDPEELRAAKPTRGRPRCLEKNVAILDAAVALFLENGFDGTSMDEVARHAGVSKQTVYSHFSSKEQLFSEAIHSKIAEYSPALTLSKLDQHTMEGELSAVCHSYAELMVSEDAIAVYRVLVAAANKGSSLAELFWKSGPEEMCQNLIDFLQSWVDRGELVIENVETAALNLLALLKGDIHYKRSIGLIDSVDEKALHKHVDEVLMGWLMVYRRRKA